MEDSELKHWIGFSRVSSVGHARVAKLEGHFGSLSDAWRAPASQLSRAGLGRRVAQRVVESRAKIDPDAELESMRRAGVAALTWHDEGYPPRLREIYDKPPVLYVKGGLLPEDERAVALVGTRKPTAYGREAARRLTADIARSGAAIVSGLAAGIDGIVHRAALEEGARTIAVLAGGLHDIYPSAHRALARRVAENGALVSEYPLGVRPDRLNFPRRNRIISGMSLGTVVVEAPEKSGALITARHALEQNREVFAVPGEILSSAHVGGNALIRDSAAKLVTCAEDILSELNLEAVERQLELAAFFPEDEAQAAVFAFVTQDPIHIDEITRKSALPASTVSGALTMMELKGAVRQVGAMNYIRLRESAAEYRQA